MSLSRRGTHSTAPSCTAPGRVGEPTAEERGGEDKGPARAAHPRADVAWAGGLRFSVAEGHDRDAGSRPGGAYPLAWGATVALTYHMWWSGGSAAQNVGRGLAAAGGENYSSGPSPPRRLPPAVPPRRLSFSERSSRASRNGAVDRAETRRAAAPAWVRWSAGTGRWPASRPIALRGVDRARARAIDLLTGSASARPPRRGRGAGGAPADGARSARSLRRSRRPIDFVFGFCSASPRPAVAPARSRALDRSREVT